MDVDHAAHWYIALYAHNVYSANHDDPPTLRLHDTKRILVKTIFLHLAGIPGLTVADI